MVTWWFPSGDPIAWVAIQGTSEADVIEQAWNHPQADQVADEILRRVQGSVKFTPQWKEGVVTARPLPDSAWEGLKGRNTPGKLNQRSGRRPRTPRAPRKASPQ
jgi:hypothetical protein